MGCELKFIQGGLFMRLVSLISKELFYMGLSKNSFDR